MADGFLRACNGGTDRTYAYLLVDRLRWLEFEAFTPETVAMRDLERYLAALGSEYAGPYGRPWRPDRRPYQQSSLDANPLRPTRVVRRRHPKMLAEGARQMLIEDREWARDRMTVTWLGDGAFRVGEFCGLHLVDLHLRAGAACGDCVSPHVHICHRENNPNRAGRSGRRHAPGREDRLELLTALIEAPGFDPLYRDELIAMPPQHPVFGWECVAAACGRVRTVAILCQAHQEERLEAKAAGSSRADFLATASPYQPKEGQAQTPCLVCPERFSKRKDVPLCPTHDDRWQTAGRPRDTELQEWLRTQAPLPGFGECLVEICPDLAATHIGLCFSHARRYGSAGRPGNARWKSGDGRVLPPECSDAEAFRQWCRNAPAAYRVGLINLRGLRPLVRAEIQWGLNHHAQHKDRSIWVLSLIQRLVSLCRDQKVASLVEYAAAGCPGLAEPPSDGVQGRHKPASDGVHGRHTRMVITEITNGLRCVYFSPADTKDLGYIETDHFGRRFPGSHSYFDLSRISQRWLRDLFWDHMTELLRSPHCPRSRSPFESTRRSGVELSAFLEASACSMKRSPWTCAARRTTSSGSGAPTFGPATWPPSQTRNFRHEHPDRTTAAIQARRNSTKQMLQRVRDTLRQMSLDHVPIKTAVVARRAEVSRTCLYQNEEA